MNHTVAQSLLPGENFGRVVGKTLFLPNNIELQTASHGDVSTITAPLQDQRGLLIPELHLPSVHHLPPPHSFIDRLKMHSVAIRGPKGSTRQTSFHYGTMTRKTVNKLIKTVQILISYGD